MWAEKLNLCTGAKVVFILGASFKDMNLCQGSVDRYVYTDTGGWVLVWLINSLDTWRGK